jgi:hypothetical protein
MKCFNCQKEIENKKIHFKDYCDFCDFDLHICKNCKHYFLGKPNDCELLDIEAVLDKEKNNFCEHFTIGNNKKDTYKTKKDVSKKLFSDDDDEEDDVDFNSLFK